MRTTTKILIIALSLLLVFSIIMAVLMKINTEVMQPVEGSGNVVTTVRPIEDFNVLTIAGNTRVILSQGDSARLAIKADDNLFDVFEISEKNGELSFYQFRRISRGSTLELHLTFVELKTMKVSRAGMVTGDAVLNFESIDLVISSGANVNIAIEANATKVNASSGSQASISGSTVELELKTSSGATVDASGLEAQNVSVNTSSGAGNKVWANNSLVMKATSGSSVIYSGNPANKVERVSLGASIRSKN